VWQRQFPDILIRNEETLVVLSPETRGVGAGAVDSALETPSQSR
jgi:hypothetical protein